MKNKYYVKAITSKDKVIGYGVYDAINGMEGEHVRYCVPNYSVEVALQLANTYRDDANSGIT